MAKKWTYIPADGVENTGPGNYVLDGDGFFISYCADTSGNIYGSPDDGEETALVKGYTFLILTGDWRKEYEALIDEGYEACVALYRANKDKAPSKYSNATPDSVSH